MKNLFIFFLLICLSSCNQRNMNVQGFNTPEGLDNSVIVPTDSVNTTIIKVDEPLSFINASDLIKEVIFIPLETTPEALIAFYIKVLIYRDKIYILDNLTGAGLYIYDINGNFLKKLGEKGGGPQDFGHPSSFNIASNGDYLVMYDNWKRQMMYYDLDGNFLKKTNVLFRQFPMFGILPSNTIVSVTGKINGNFHLGDYEKFRLIFSDTLGHIHKFGFDFDDNINLLVGWSGIFCSNDELLFYQQYTNSIYSVMDTIIREKYRIDCSRFSQFDLNKISQFDNVDDFDKYWYQKANLNPYIGENSSHLFFIVNDKYEKYKYFYDKRSKKHIGFKEMNFDNDFFCEFTYDLFSYGDYFIGKASPSDLSELKKKREAAGNPVSEAVSKMINNLGGEDNDVLVLFKIKDL